MAEYVRVWDDGVLYRVFAGGVKVPIVEVARIPRAKYDVVEEEDGWVVYGEDHHGAFS